jgi:hypothetical protein
MVIGGKYFFHRQELYNFENGMKVEYFLLHKG